MSCWKHGRRGRWHFEGMTRDGSEGGGMCGPRRHSRRSRRHGAAPSSGNHAFDEYRQETLRRLEDEQSEFEGFLERLRHAKDKMEFDQFMDERRRKPETPDAPEGAAPQPNG